VKFPKLILIFVPRAPVRSGPWLTMNGQFPVQSGTRLCLVLLVVVVGPDSDSGPHHGRLRWHAVQDRRSSNGHRISQALEVVRVMFV